MSDSRRDERIDSLFRGALERALDERDAWVRAEETDASIVDEVLGRLARVDRPSDAEPRGSRSSIGGMPSSQILERLSSHSPKQSRYKLVGELGSGAQGAVLRVWDEDLRRQLAMKVVLGHAPTDDEGETPEVDPRTLSRFLEEAQITGQLDHPGIVPVHELGVDDEGRVYFTMRLVKGETLITVLRDLHAGTGDWTLTRVVGLLLRACEAVAFAHDRRVIHRDIKPANLMVGRYGEVYVMDWGLGRVIGEPETKDVRLAGEPEDPPTLVATFRKEEESDELLTLDGDVVGTPAYMAPEQARGQLEAVGPQADVYSLGATLYHALTGSMPYAEDRRQSARVVWAKLLEGPPRPVAELAPRVPPELIAICNKAMARTMDERYASVAELAFDLRAYLEDRVVRAYRTGPITELRKWTRRNRGVAATLAALFVVLVSSGFATTWLELQRARVLERSLDRREATADLAELDASWPIHPESESAMEAWLASARALVRKLPHYRAELEALEEENGKAPRIERAGETPEAQELRELRFRHSLYEPGITSLGVIRDTELAKPDRDEWVVNACETGIPILQAGLPILKAREGVLLALSEGARSWRYADPAREHEYESLERVVRAQELFANEGLGIRAVEARLERARRLHAESITEHADKWARAIASIENDCPLYDGRRIAPQLGLVPLRKNPESGLWEFWHVLSGDAPVEDGAGYRIEPATGVVLVLVPGGTFKFGADPSDGLATKREKPQHAVTLEPYFLSRYEMTQAQWYRLTGTIPSEHYDMGQFERSPRISRTNPVESVTWRESARALALWNLALPTEAQWERAARAGTTKRYGASRWFTSIVDSVNFADRSLHESQERNRMSDDRHLFLTIVDRSPGLPWGVHAMQYGPRALLTAIVAITQITSRVVRESGKLPVPPAEPDDHHVLHATVDRFPPNAWGLHAMAGNLWEWTRDWSSPISGYALDGIDARTGQHDPTRRHWKSARGGGFRSDPEQLRVTARSHYLPDSIHDDLGVRPMRALDP